VAVGTRPRCLPRAGAGSLGRRGRAWNTCACNRCRRDVGADPDAPGLREGAAVPAAGEPPVAGCRTTPATRLQRSCNLVAMVPERTAKRPSAPLPTLLSMSAVKEICLRCGAEMEWRHGTWQCTRCRLKLGCCEGEPQSAQSACPPLPTSVQSWQPSSKPTG